MQEDVREQMPQNVEGAGTTDEASELSRGGETPDNTGADTGDAGLNNIATTEDGGLAIAGGKLPGNHDDFEGELEEGPHAVPGANRQHHPAHAMNKGETKHLGI